MAWSHVSNGSWVRDSGVDPAIALTAPSGSGGILILLASSRNGNQTWNTPTGWTAINTPVGVSARNGCYARVSDGGANDSPTFSLTGDDYLTGFISRWSGGNTTIGSLLNVKSTDLYGYIPGGIDVPSITPTVDSCLVIRGGMTKWNDGPYYAVPAGDTFLSEDDYTGAMWSAWCYRIQTTAATVATGQIDNNSTSADSYGIGMSLTAGAAGSPLILPHRSSGGMIDLSGNFRG